MNQPNHNAPPLNLLRSHIGPASALLLASFAKSHSDFVSFDDIETVKRDGMTMMVGSFTHRASGRRYQLTVTEISEPL